MRFFKRIAIGAIAVGAVVVPTSYQDVDYRWTAYESGDGKCYNEFLSEYGGVETQEIDCAEYRELFEAKKQPPSHTEKDLIIPFINAAVTFDASSNSGAKTTVSSYTWSHTTASSDEDYGLFVGVSSQDDTGTTTVSSITYNGVSMTQVATVDVEDNTAGNAHCTADLWELAAPSSGSNTVSVTLDGTTDYSVAGAATFSRVNQTNPISATTTQTKINQGQTITTSITPTAADTMIFDTICAWQNVTAYTFAADSAQTETWGVDFSGDNTMFGGGSYEANTGTAATSSAWTVTGFVSGITTDFAHIVSEIQEADDTDFEFYHAETNTEVIDLTAPSLGAKFSMETLQIDRSNKNKDKDFLIFGSISTSVQNTGHSVGTLIVSSLDGAATTTLDNSNAFQSDTVDNGPTSLFIRKHTISPQKDQYGVGFFSDTTTDDVGGRYASVMAMEIPASATSSVHAANQTTGASTAETDVLTLGLRPGTTQDHLIFAYMNVRSESWNDTAAPIFKFKAATSTTQILEQFDVDGGSGNPRPFSSATPNDDKYLPLGFVDILVDVPSTATTTISLTMQGNGTNDEASAKEAIIVAIPLTDSGIVTSELEVKGNIEEAAGAYTDVVNHSYKLTKDGDHAAFYLTEASHDNTGGPAGFQWKTAGTTYEGYTTSRWDSDFGARMPQLAGFGFTGSGTKTFEIEGKGTGSNTAQFENSRIVILDLGNLVGSRRLLKTQIK